MEELNSKQYVGVKDIRLLRRHEIQVYRGDDVDAPEIESAVVAGFLRGRENENPISREYNFCTLLPCTPFWASSGGYHAV